MSAPGPRLLLLACSARKQADPCPLPAIERYDGPAFRVLRRYLARNDDPALHVYALSARFGLVAADTPLPPYDERLTPARADALRSDVQQALAAVFALYEWQSCFIYAGRAYYALMAPFLAAMCDDGSFVRADGPPGVRLARLRAWLDGDASPDLGRPTRARGVPCLRGVPIDLTPDEALARLRAHHVESDGASSAAVWWVDLGGAALPAKRAATALTGLPPTAFGTGEAVRLLRQLGLEVARR